MCCDSPREGLGNVAFPKPIDQKTSLPKEYLFEKKNGMDLYILPNVKQIASGKQPRSTGRSAQCFVTT